MTRARRSSWILGLAALLAVLTVPAPLIGDTFNFTVTADPRSSVSRWDAVLAAMNDKIGGQGAFQVSCGDIDPPQPLRDKIDARFGASALWYPGIGNHERETPEDMNWLRNEYNNGNGVRTPLKEYTNQDGPASCVETTYSWDYGNAHFIMLNEYWDGSSDTGTDGDIVPALYNWLADDLAANTQPVVFVFGHEPAYPFHRHVGDSLDKYPAHRDAFWDLLETEDVQAYFTGHTHYYSSYQKTPASTWQIDVGNAGNEPSSSEGQTFANVTVTDTSVRYDIWRNGSGSWVMEHTWTVQVGLKIKLNKTEIYRTVNVGENLSDDTFTVAARGPGTLNYSISDDANWLSEFPTSGTSTGEEDTITITYDVDGLGVGQYQAQITVSSGDAVNSPQTIDVTVSVIDPEANLIANGDFSNGLTGWIKWTERGSFTPTVNNGQLHIQSTEHNGGMYQQFNTGGSGRQIDIDGFWASDPTVANYQWAEVLIINSTRLPVDGQDIVDGQSDVVLIYKNDTWASPSGWSGQMDQTAPVRNVGTFTSAGDVATIILKSGNLGGPTSGTRFDDVVVKPQGAPTPTITLDPTSLSPSTDEGSSPAADSFTVQNTGGGTLNYTITDDVNWLSVDPDSGSSTGEADTITVNYSTESLSAGIYYATITVSDPNASNNPQTVDVTLTVNAAKTTVAEDFETMPSWSSSWDAGWGSAASWSIVSGGQSGNALQASRSSAGSSAKVKVYDVDASTDYTISIYMKCPSYGGTYWAECAYRLGSHSAQDFDENSGSWTMVKKFSNDGDNGNGNQWVQYSKNFNTGSNTQISVGYKLGSWGGGGPTVRWDTLRVD